jgi:hypothetical protein
MLRRGVFGFIAALSLFLAFYFVPYFGLSSLLDFGLFSIETGKFMLIGLLFFSCYMALVSVAGMTKLKFKYALVIILVSSLSVFLKFQGLFGAMLYFGLSLSSLYYYDTVRRHSEDEVHIDPSKISNNGISFAFTIIFVTSCLSVYIYSSALTIEETVPTGIIDFSSGLMGEQVESIGCSFNETVRSCAEILISDQLSSLEKNFLKQCESLQSASQLESFLARQVEAGCRNYPEELQAQCVDQALANLSQNPLSSGTIKEQCESQIESALESQKEHLIKSSIDSLQESLGVDLREEESMGDIVRRTMRQTFIDLLKPYERFIPFVVTALTLTFLSFLSIVPRILTPLLSSVFLTVSLKEGILVSEKKIIEIDVVRFPKEQPIGKPIKKKKKKKEDEDDFED